MDRYYLGTHEPSWLQRPEFAATAPRSPYQVDTLALGVEGALFVSHARLRRLKTYRPAVVPWALDSMGFSMLQQHGRWLVDPQEYVDAIYRYEDEIGMLEWASPQDWMCEAAIREGGTWGGVRFAGTGKTVQEHQELTVASFLDLTERYEENGSRPATITGIPCDWYGDSPIMPVLQGDPTDPESHLRCADLYESAGVHLAEYPIVGVGSVCRLQSTAAITAIISGLAELGIRMHGFGVKIQGLAQYGHLLTSADSMAWSRHRKNRPPLPGCAHGRTGTGSCANCPRAALQWRDRVALSLDPTRDCQRNIAA